MSVGNKLGMRQGFALPLTCLDGATVPLIGIWRQQLQACAGSTPCKHGGGGCDSAVGNAVCEGRVQ